MAQYRPSGKVNREAYQEINRRVSADEMEAAYEAAKEAGLWRFDERRRMILRLG
jgi:uncharacterized Fe-S radical SAM superfamily protein PflX